MRSLALVPAEGNSMPKPYHDPREQDVIPYTRDTIDHAKQWQHAARFQAARDMGIPGDLVALYEVYGFDQMETWTHMLRSVSRD